MSSGLEFTSREEKLSILSLMLKMQNVDEKNHPNERQMLFDLCKVLNISPEELESAPINRKLAIPKHESDRVVILYHLLFLMRMDSEITQNEIDLFQQAGMLLGIRATMTEELIELIVENVKKEIPVGHMREIITKYLN